MTIPVRDHAMPLVARTKAPEFALPCTPDQCVALSELWGRPMIVACDDALGFLHLVVQASLGTGFVSIIKAIDPRANGA